MREASPPARGRSILRCAALVAVLASGWSCGDGRTPIVIYSPHGRDLLALLEQAYEAENPAIDIRWLDMGSQEVYDRVRSEKANPQADIWFGGPDTIFAQGAAEGLLAEYRPQWADAVPAASRHEGLYHGIYRSSPVLVYNSDAVSVEEAPRDWDDLLQPVWTGKLIIRDPLASGTMRTIFGAVLARSVVETGSPERGFEWLRALDRQTKEYVFNPTLLFEKLVRQEGLVSMWELTDILLLIERGSPLRYRFATSGTPIIDDAIGLVAGSEYPDEAKDFIDWAGSRAALLLAIERAFRLPARTDLPPEDLPQWARDALEEMVPAEIDYELIARHGTAWMATWDREIRGRG